MSWLNCNWLPCVFVQPDSEYTVVSKYYCVQTMKAFELMSVVLSPMSLSLGALEKSWKSPTSVCYLGIHDYSLLCYCHYFLMK